MCLSGTGFGVCLDTRPHHESFCSNLVALIVFILFASSKESTNRTQNVYTLCLLKNNTLTIASSSSTALNFSLRFGQCTLVRGGTFGCKSYERMLPNIGHKNKQTSIRRRLWRCPQMQRKFAYKKNKDFCQRNVRRIFLVVKLFVFYISRKSRVFTKAQNDDIQLCVWFALNLRAPKIFA